MDIRLQLQVKKHPQAYVTLYKNEVEKMRGMIKISKIDPEAKNPELCSLLVFLPHVSEHYDEDIAGDIFTYALDYYTVLDKSLSQSAITAVILLKKSKQIGPEIFYTNAIPLIEEMDKRTKTVFIQFLLAEIIRDKEHWGQIQDVLDTAIRSGVEAHSKRAAYIYMHLVSRGAWADQSATEKIFSLLLKSPAVVINFIFMYMLDKIELVVREEEIEIPEETQKRKTKIKRETKGDTRRKERQKKEIEKKIAKREEKKQMKEPNLVVLLERLGDKGPRYAAKVFRQVKASEHAPELKLKMAQIVARMGFYYKINIKGFLGYMTRFLFPHQKNLPAVFSAIAQSIHENTEGKEVEATCEVIVENFCNEYKDDDIIAYGINALRAIIRRYPESAKYQCIEDVLDYRRSKKRQAATASTALKKMVAEAERAHLKGKEDSDEGDDGSDGSSEGDRDDRDEEEDDDNDSDNNDSDDDESNSIEDSNEFVTEEAISKIRVKPTKEEMKERAIAEKVKRKKKELPTTNRVKQKERNYTVRKTKRKIIGKKISSKAKKGQKRKKY